MNKYVSIDIETTGLNPDKHQILEFGAVIDDGSPIDECPTFRYIVKHDQICGDPYALAMNQELLYEMANPGTTMFGIENLFTQFNAWLHVQGLTEKIVVAGKNYANFDLRFLEKLVGWNTIEFDHRIIDVGNLYWRPSEDGAYLPPMGKCLKRAGLDPTVTHHAIDDAKQVIQLIRALC